MTEVWYRYEDHLVSLGYDYEYDRSWGSRVEIRLREFEVLRKTPKGVWIDLGCGVFSGGERFVLASARKRYACPTKEEARESFIARKKAQARIYEAGARRAKEALKALEDV